MRNWGPFWGWRGVVTVAAIVGVAGGIFAQSVTETVTYSSAGGTRIRMLLDEANLGGERGRTGRDYLST